MQRRNRLAHALYEAVIVRERAVLFSIRCSRQDDISGGCRLCLKEFLDYQEIELRECVLMAFKVFRQEAACDIERANRIARRVQHSTGRRLRLHHPHIVRSDAVVEERQRVEEDATISRNKLLPHLSDRSEENT